MQNSVDSVHIRTFFNILIQTAKVTKRNDDKLDYDAVKRNTIQQHSLFYYEDKTTINQGARGKPLNKATPCNSSSRGDVALQCNHTV
jgi:hypothetical protein